MTEHNIFQEIDEDLQRQKLEALWNRYGMLVILGALAIVLATAGFGVWRSWHTKRDQTATATLVELMNSTDPDPRKTIDALTSYAKENHSLTQGTLAQMHAAEIAAQIGNKDQAIQLYDTVAQDSHADKSLRQMADLMSVELQMETGDLATLFKRLEPLSVEKAPWRFSAMEYQGYLALRMGDKAKAREIFTALSQNAEAPATLSARAGEILHSLTE